jgi:hypothetical protein
VDGSYVTLDGPGAINTAALGINGAAQIVGEYFVPGVVHGFYRDVDGSYTALDVPGANQTTLASGINDAGLIVGYYVDSNRNEHGFLATPSS